MFFEELGESGDRDVEGVGTVVMLESSDVGLLLQPPGGLEAADQRLRFFVDLIGKGRERLCLGTVDESTLLEKKRGVLLSVVLLLLAYS